MKIYSRHSGGVVTYDLVNEVLKDANVPPMLGAMDSEWDRIDYDGSFYFHSDKIFELREEFQKEISLALADDDDFQSICPVEDKHTEQLKLCVQNLVTAALFADSKSQSEAIAHAFQTPLMGAVYRVIVSKMVQLLAFKQQDPLSQRCWRLLRACNYNARANHNACKPEYFHLAEVLVSQLMAPYETIKAPHLPPPTPLEEAAPEGADAADTAGLGQATVKMELEEQLKMEPEQELQQQDPQSEIPAENVQEEHTIYSLETEDEGVTPEPEETEHLSHYFASPVGNALVDELCETIGQLASQSGYLHGECLFLIMRRLTRFFEGRDVCSERGEVIADHLQH